MKDPYTILGVSRDASDDEIRNAYRELVRKYHPDNFTDDNPLKDLATEKMQEVNEAYDAVMQMRATGSHSTGSENYYSGNTYTGGSSGAYGTIRQSINARKFREAEEQLFAIPSEDRNAEWHYLASVLLMHRGRQNDAMRELEIACTMDPTNVEYQKAKEMFNNASRSYGSTYYGGNTYTTRSSTDDACNCCTNLLCMDCLCECLGGDLIPCL